MRPQTIPALPGHWMRVPVESNELGERQGQTVRDSLPGISICRILTGERKPVARFAGSEIKVRNRLRARGFGKARYI